jgi:S-adenosylmethionine-diacylglycerol 3-amino-3-carboxypropyl transferase
MEIKQGDQRVQHAGRCPLKQRTNLVEHAVTRREAGIGGRILDKAFTAAFKGLVYAQIWEDPVVDMDGLAIRPDSRIVTIASGGCNALSYLVADPAQVIAVDLNPAHLALNRLKIAAVRHLDDYASLRRFLVEADNDANIAIYRERLEPHLDEFTRRYWNGRDVIGRRRIGGFSRNIYKQGLLGNFIGCAHMVARLYRTDLGEVLTATTMEDQRRIFDDKIAPIFDRPLVRWLTSQPASLFGLGIPPAQFQALAGESRMSDVLRERLEKLACHFPVNDNYFAWQAFGRAYGRAPEHSLPPYLQPENHATVRSRIGRLQVHHTNLVDLLRAESCESLDCYLLLDAQDWMDNDQLTALWTQITRTARRGARVLFRTAAAPSLLPGRLSDEILRKWDYADGKSRDLTRADRASIYGGVHLYRLRG